MAITRTQLFPVEGQSPIVLHNVPQSVELVGDITGDKGTNEVWDDTKGIEDFEVKITTLDEYSTGVPHKVIKRVDTLNTTSKEWIEGTQETYEASEKTFNLSYKGHERDFEVKVVEGGEGSGESLPTPIVVSDGGDTYYFYEIESLEEEWKDEEDNKWCPLYEDEEGNTLIPEEAELEFEIGTNIILEDPSEIIDDKWYAMSLVELPKSTLTNKNIPFTTDGEPIEGSHLTFVSSSSSPKLQIRYRWGMNDSHDLSVEKNITITERPRPVEPEGGGDSDESERTIDPDAMIFLGVEAVVEGHEDWGSLIFSAVKKDYTYTLTSEDQECEHGTFYFLKDNEVYSYDTCNNCYYGPAFGCVNNQEYKDFLSSHPDYIPFCIYLDDEWNPLLSPIILLKSKNGVVDLDEDTGSTPYIESEWDIVGSFTYPYSN